MNKLQVLGGLLALTLAAPVTDRRIDDPIAASVASPARLASDLARDADRRPQRVLDFFDIKRGMHVADLMAGDGYYSELLARAVGPEGRVYCQNTSIPLERFAAEPLSARLAREGLDNVVRLDREFDDVGLPQDLDAAILIRFYHDFAWQEVDRAAFNRMVFAHLKPGGVFGVVDHVAADGAGISEGQRLHRVEPALVRRELEAAGFVLEAESFVLANPDDEHDWNIFSEGRRDRADRFVHLYRKPE